MKRQLLIKFNRSQLYYNYNKKYYCHQLYIITGCKQHHIS